MKKRLQLLRDQYSSKLKPLFQVLVRLPVHFEIWISDQQFLRSVENPVLGRPSALGTLFALQASFWRAIRAIWKEARTEYTLQVYKTQNLVHYAKGGRGYLNLDKLSKQECMNQFAGLDSRLQLFLDSYPATIGYKDGESFLDAGCGKGQNLKFILSRYPRSPYTGFDIDERCLRVAKAGVDGSVNRTLSQGSILDFEFLGSFTDKSVDHVLICHVFSTLLEPTILQTQSSHQRIVDEFVRIAKKSVIVIDTMSLGRAFQVEIEHLTRATIRENIAAYFAKHQSAGETCILSCQDFRAVLFKAIEA
jgi:ubiquinone/menaquinone biosynthesis C-methylase UbiE